jgi:hypothetical protein
MADRSDPSKSVAREFGRVPFREDNTPGGKTVTKCFKHAAYETWLGSDIPTRPSREHEKATNMLILP